MEILFPSAPYLHGSGLFFEQSSRSHPGARRWTQEENKRFENALAEFDEGTPDRWEKVAGTIPGKTAEDVKRHYQDLEADVCHIEAGLIPLPGYSSPAFSRDWVNSRTWDGLKQHPYDTGGKRSWARPCDQERKKGIPWTRDEHELFLRGLEKHGKGDWRSISRNFVKSRTPTQVASHAQKYFIRHNSSSGKDKRRPSIHDITTVDARPPPSPPGPPQLSAIPPSDIYSATSAVSPTHERSLFSLPAPPPDGSPCGSGVVKFEPPPTSQLRASLVGAPKCVIPVHHHHGKATPVAGWAMTGV